MAKDYHGVQGVTDNLSAANAQTNPESGDDKLAHRVEFELYSTKAISLKTVHIHADNGTVTLTGNVASRAEKLLAEKTAQSVEGVGKSWTTYRCRTKRSRKGPIRDPCQQCGEICMAACH